MIKIEPVVVNQKIPKYLPKFQNPIYLLALKEKYRLRKEVIERIKKADFENGLYSLILTLKYISEIEVKSIIEAWEEGLKLDEKDKYLLCLKLYQEALLSNNLEKIKENDKYYSFNKEKFVKKLGRS